MKTFRSMVKDSTWKNVKRELVTIIKSENKDLLEIYKNFYTSLKDTKSSENPVETLIYKKYNNFYGFKPASTTILSLRNENKSDIIDMDVEDAFKQSGMNQDFFIAYIINIIL